MKRAAVFISAGLGDAVLQIPMIRRLQNENEEVDLIITSAESCENIFQYAGFKATLKIVRSNGDWLKLFFGKRNYYDTVYLNYFAAVRKNIFIARQIGKKIFHNHERIARIFSNDKRIIYIKPNPELHDISQNLFLSGNNTVWTESELLIGKLRHKEKVIAFQPGAGNNKTPFKIWPLENWIAFLKLCLQSFPQMKFVLLGDKNESEIGEKIKSQFKNAVDNQIGKTTMTEAIKILDESFFYVGHDSGLMHLAAALETPTFTIWGATDYLCYGLQDCLPEKNKIVFHKLPCWSCSSWLHPNHSRVQNPLYCPDFACLQLITPEKAFAEFSVFFTKVTAKSNA
jgi:ADP-heptose:LPS heptosyltransferase